MYNDLTMQACEQIEISMKKYFAPENLTELFDMFVKFPQMPYYNIFLILRQKPKAMLICGKQAWSLYGGTITSKNPIILLCPEYVEIETVDEDNSSLLGERTGHMNLKAVPCFDISQVEISQEKKEELLMKSSAPDFIDALKRQGLRVVEDDLYKPKLKHELVKSDYNYDSNMLLLNPRISPEEKQKEAMVAYVTWYMDDNYRNNENIAPELGAYISELQDYSTEILKRYYGIADNYEVTPSSIFSESSFIQGMFLRELSNSVFTIIQAFENKSSLTFNETMFCNIFLNTTDRNAILELVNEMFDRTYNQQLLQDLIAFRDIFVSEVTISTESIEELYRKKENQELFTFPSKIYALNE